MQEACFIQSFEKAMLRARGLTPPGTCLMIDRRPDCVNEKSMAQPKVPAFVNYKD